MKSANHFIERIGEWKIVAVICLIALTLQLVFLPAPNFYGEPYLVAKNIVAGNGFTFTYPITSVGGPTCYVTPLYTYLAAGILWLGMGEHGIQIVNLLFLLAACVAVYRLFRKVSSPIVAIVSFAALCFYIPLWILAYSMEPNSLNMLLIVLTVNWLYELARQPSRKLWIGLGILSGLQMLARPDILIGLALFMPWLLWKGKADAVRTLKGIAGAIAVALLIVSPWTIRNYVTFHRFVLVSANAGMNLYEGNNWVATGEFSENPATPESRAEFAKIEAFSMDHDQIQIDDYRLQLSKDWIISHPQEVLVLDLKKFWYHWFGRPIMGEQFHYKYQALATVYRIATALMIALGFFGLWRLRDHNLRSLLIITFAYSTLVSMIFFVQSRHRLIKVDPFLIPLAVMAVAQLYAMAKQRFSHNLPVKSERAVISNV